MPLPAAPTRARGRLHWHRQTPGRRNFTEQPTGAPLRGTRRHRRSGPPGSAVCRQFPRARLCPLSASSCQARRTSSRASLSDSPSATRARTCTRLVSVRRATEASAAPPTPGKNPRCLLQSSEGQRHRTSKPFSSSRTSSRSAARVSIPRARRAPRGGRADRAFPDPKRLAEGIEIAIGDTARTLPGRLIRPGDDLFGQRGAVFRAPGAERAAWAPLARHVDARAAALGRARGLDPPDRPEHRAGMALLKTDEGFAGLVVPDSAEDCEDAREHPVVRRVEVGLELGCLAGEALQRRRRRLASARGGPPSTVAPALGTARRHLPKAFERGELLVRIQPAGRPLRPQPQRRQLGVGPGLEAKVVLQRRQAPGLDPQPHRTSPDRRQLEASIRRLELLAVDREGSGRLPVGGQHLAADCSPRSNRDDGVGRSSSSANLSRTPRMDGEAGWTAELQLRLRDGSKAGRQLIPGRRRERTPSTPDSQLKTQNSS